MFNFTLVHFSSIFIWSFLGELSSQNSTSSKTRPPEDSTFDITKFDLLSMFPNSTNSWAPPMLLKMLPIVPLSFVFTMQWEREKNVFSFLLLFRSHPRFEMMTDRWERERELSCVSLSLFSFLAKIFRLPIQRWNMNFSGR